MTWGGLLPTTPQVMMRYLQAFASQLNARTLIRRTTALKHWHTYQGFADPTADPLVRKTLTGILHVHGQPKQKATALTLEHSHMVNFIQQHDSLAMWRNNALLQVGFFGALRRSELAHLQIEHLTFLPEGVEILIPRSKTDPTGEGQYCAIPYGDQILCPVTALKIWCEKAKLQSGFIFCAVDKHQNIGTTPLTGKSIAAIIKSMVVACQLPDAITFSGHSLRRGFATTASREGASFVSIMRHGRWRHEGTVLGYIEEGQRFEANAAKVILKKTPQYSAPDFIEDKI